MPTKQCSLCRETKELDAFSPHPKSADGRQSQCKLCATATAKQRRERFRARSEEELQAVFDGLSDDLFCIACGKDRPKSEFTRDRGRASTLGNQCKSCMAARNKELRLLDPDGHKARSLADYGNNRGVWRNQQLKKKFGVSLEEYGVLLEKQGGACAICKRPETAVRNGRVKMLAVDHCHASGTFRALLCMNCNQGLGYFRDDPDLLVAAAAYLWKHRQAT